MLDPRFNTWPLSERPGDADVNAALRMIRLKLASLPSGKGMFVDDLISDLKSQEFEESAIRWAIHEGRADEGRKRGFWFIRSMAQQGVDSDSEKGPVRCREVQYIQPVTYTPPCSVDLSGEKPLVFGKEKPPLSPKTQLAVQLLIDAYPEGLTTAELKNSFGGGDAVALLRDLCKKDEDWRRAIIMPGIAKQGQKYGLNPDQQ